MTSLPDLMGPLLTLLLLVGIVALVFGLLSRLRCCLGLIALALAGLGAVWLLVGERGVDNRQPDQASPSRSASLRPRTAAGS